MKLTRFHALKILEWCQLEYGNSKYNSYDLELAFHKPTYLTEGLLGEYDPIENTIFINSKDHETLEELCKTVIEEYWHYLKDDEEYQDLYNSYDYDDHPHEAEAKAMAESDWVRCLEDLKASYKQFQ